MSTNYKIATLEGMEVSATDALDDTITTITQSIEIDTELIPKNYFMTSKGLLRLREKGKTKIARS